MNHYQNMIFTKIVITNFRIDENEQKLLFMLFIKIQTMKDICLENSKSLIIKLLPYEIPNPDIVGVNGEIKRFSFCIDFENMLIEQNSVSRIIWRRGTIGHRRMHFGGFNLGSTEKLNPHNIAEPLKVFSLKIF